MYSDVGLCGWHAMLSVQRPVDKQQQYNGLHAAIQQCVMREESDDELLRSTSLYSQQDTTE